MAHNPAPPRPGGPPRPKPENSRSARPASRPRPKMGGKSWSPGDDAPAAPLKKPEIRSPGAGKTGDEHLSMVPLSGDKTGTYDNGKKDSATSFFAIPGANRNGSGPAAPAPMAAAAPMVAGPIAGPVPPAPIVMGPQPVSGIAGPVAGGMGGAPGMSMAGSAYDPGAIQDQRSSSNRVFVVVTMLVMVVCMALVVAVGLLVFAFVQSQKVEKLPVPNNNPAVKITRAPVDTGKALKTPMPKVVKPKPIKKTRPGPRPAASPKPSAAPVPSGPSGGTMTIIKPEGEMLTSIEVRCGRGYRERGRFVGNTASVAGVPAETCSVSFKGGAATRKQKLTGAGTYRCTGTGSSLVCR